MLLALLFIHGLAAAQPARSPETEFEQTRQRLLIDGDVRAALRRYETIASNPAATRATRAGALFEAGRCYERLGDKSSIESYRRLLLEYPDETAFAARARERLSRLEAPSKPLVQRIADAASIGAFSTVAPDGRRVAFASFDDQLAVLETASGEVRSLTPRNSKIRSLVFSPDGSHVAYGAGTDPETRSLRIATVEGGSSRLVVSPGASRFLAPADWFGNTLLAAFEARSRESASLATVSLANGAVQTLRSFQGGHPLPARYSPDGRYIAYTLGSNIYVMTADGVTSWPVVMTAGSDRLVGWSGSHLVFLSDRRGALDLWALPVRSGRPTGDAIALHRNLDQTASLGMSRDGGFYYMSTTPTSEIFAAALDSPSGELKQPVAAVDPAAAGINGFVDWSPDGTRIAFWSRPAGRKPLLKIRHLQTGEERVIQGNVSEPGSVRWFPDGASILTEAFDPQHGERFYKITLSDGTFSLLIPFDLSRDASKNPTWIEAGRMLLFRARLGGYRSPGPGELYAWDVASGNLRKIAATEQFGSWALASSGKKIAYLIHEGPADVVRIGELGSATTRVVYRTQPGQFLSKSAAVAWTMDEAAVIAVIGTAENPRTHELWRFPVNDGEPRRLLSSGVIKDLRMHPDGSRFAFTATGVRQEIWALRNILPQAMRNSLP